MATQTSSDFTPSSPYRPEAFEDSKNLGCGPEEAASNELLKVVVHAKRQEALNVVSLDLRSCDGGPLPAFTAGAHIDVHCAGGLVRQYSLCNDPQERFRYLVAVLREPASRGGSRALHDDVHDGQSLLISKPRNHFALVENASRSLLLAGGIGVTPLLAMAEQLTGAGADFALHYCARSPEQMAFRDRLLGSRFSRNVHLHFDNGADSQRMNAAALLSSPAAHAHLYVCGPRGFIDFVIDGARERGWQDHQIHREYFAGDPEAARDGDAFQVRLARTGQVLNVPADRTVVDVLSEAGIDIEVSCEQGVCGTCRTGLLGGDPDHRDMFLTDQERAAGKFFMPCCSRGKGVVVLDL